MSDRICGVADCGRKVVARGYCTRHYQRLMRTGDPLACARSTDNGEAQAWLRAHAAHEGDECLAWPFARTVRGYGVVLFRGRQMNAHRAMCILAHGEPPAPDLQAAHACGKGHAGCCNPRHLRWATAVENMADQVRHGTRAQGERHGRRRIGEAEVRAIRRLAGRQKQREIAAQFGISREQVGKIIRGERWRASA